MTAEIRPKLVQVEVEVWIEPEQTGRGMPRTGRTHLLSPICLTEVLSMKG